MSHQEESIQALLDKQAITEVIHRYCRGVDRSDRDLINSVYHDDALDNHGIWKGKGVDFSAWMLPQLTETKTSHMVTNLSIELQGDAAFTEAYCFTVSEDTNGRLTVFCRYVDRFEKRNNEWKIANRVVVFDIFNADSLGEKPDMGPNLTYGCRSAADPSYQK